MATLNELMAKLPVSTENAVAKPKSVEELMSDIGLKGKSFAPDYSRVTDIAKQMDQMNYKSQLLKQKAAQTQNNIDNGIQELKTQTTKATPVKDFLQYIGNTIGKALTTVAGSMNPLVILDNAYAIKKKFDDTIIYELQIAGSTLTGGLIPMPTSEPVVKTLTKDISDYYKRYGGKDIDTSKINNQDIKYAIDKWNQGINPFVSTIQDVNSYFQGRTDEVSDKVGYGTKLLSQVLGTVPQLALLVSTGGLGTLAYATSAYNSAVTNEIGKQGEISDNNLDYALLSATVDVVSESVFSLAKGNLSLYKGALEQQGKLLKNATVGELAWGIVKQGAEEGSEELIAYPFQMALDWKYKNPDASIEDYANWQTVQKWAEAGLVGFLAGGLMSTVPAIQQARQGNAMQKAFQLQAEKIIKMKPSEITPEVIDEFLDSAIKAKAPVTVPAETTVTPTVQPKQTTAQLMQEIMTLGTKINTPITKTDSVIPQVTTNETDPTKGELISEKTSTGNIYKLNDKVYKSATFKDGKTKTLESDVYNALSDSDVISDGKIVTINGKEYIETPYYERVVSVDSVPVEDREMYESIISENKERINQSVMELTNAGYNYSDPLQFGYRNNKLYLMDFSNVSSVKSVSRDYSFVDNYNYLSNFYKDFGFDKMAKIVSTAISIRRNLETTSYEDVKNRENGFIFIPKELQETIYDLKMQFGDALPNNVYYATNRRAVQIGDIAQTDSIDGIKYIFSENPIQEFKRKDYELTVLYEGKVQINPVSIQARENKKTKNTLTTAQKPQKPTLISKEVKVPVKEMKVVKKVSSESIAGETRKQDTSAVNSIMPKSVREQVSDIKENNVSEGYKSEQSKETREELQKSFNPLPEMSFVEKAVEFGKWIKKNLVYGSVPIDYKFGDIRQAFRQLRIADTMASKKAEQIISLAYNKVGKKKFELMRSAIIYSDLIEDVNNKKYGPKSSLPFKIKSIEELMRTYQKIQNELAKAENSEVVEALKTRKRLTDEVRDNLIAQGDKAGIDFRIVYAKTDYMYHAVTEFQEEFNGAIEKMSRKNKVEFKERIGSDMNYISDPVLADFILIRSLERNIAKINLFNSVKEQDITSELAINKEGFKILPKDYVEFNPPDLGIVTYNEESKQIMTAIAYKTLAANGISTDSAEGKSILKNTLSQASKETIIIPKQIADALKNEFTRVEHGGSRFMKQVTNVWKYTKIRLPGVVIKYNLRNFFGDLDAVMIGNPTTLRRIPQAVRELYAFYYRNGVMTNNVYDFIQITGLTTGQTVQTLKSLKSVDKFEFYSKSNLPKDVVKRGLSKAWKILTLETTTDFREQVLRYAAYLEAINTWASEKGTGLPSYYWASVPREIQSISDRKVRAAKYSNDGLGAYDDTSIVGKYLADHLIPFYRFTEVNMKRYFRMTKNAFYQDPATIRRIGESTASKYGVYGKLGASAVLKIGRLAIGTLLFYGLIDLLNKLFAPDEEDKLPMSVKNTPHLTVPSWIVGDSDRVYYIDRLGSFSELFNMFGIDYGIRQDMEDILSGKMDLKDKVLEIVTSPIYSEFNSSMPIAKLVTGVITGLDFYPDPTQPVQIKDKWEYMFKQVGLDEEYKALLGKPIQEGSYAKEKRSILFNSVSASDSAFWDLYDIKDRFIAANNITTYSSQKNNPDSMDYKKSMAAYYYKRALKLDDTKAAKKYLLEYVQYGGTQKTLSQSMAWLDPTEGMKTADKEKFLEWMTPEEKETYDKAMRYVKELSAESEKYVGQNMK